MSTLALANASRRRQTAGLTPNDLLPPDRPGFLSRFASDARDVLYGIVPGLAELAVGAVEAPVMGVRSILDPSLRPGGSRFEEQRPIQLARGIGESVAGTANLLFDDIFPGEFLRDVAQGRDASEAGQAYRDRLREHGEQFSETPASFLVEHLGNAALTGAAAGRAAQAGALARAPQGAAVRQAVRRQGAETYNAARTRQGKPPIEDLGRLSRAQARVASSPPGAAVQALSDRGRTRTAGLRDIAEQGGPGSRLASAGLFGADVIGHPYLRGVQAANRGLGRVTGGAPGMTLTGLATDLVNRPQWTQAADRANAIETDISAMRETLADLDTQRDAALNRAAEETGGTWMDSPELADLTDQTTALQRRIAERTAELEQFRTANADAIRRGQASLDEEGLATLHPLAAQAQRMRHHMPGNRQARNRSERWLAQFDEWVSPERRETSSLTRDLRDQLDQVQKDIEARNTPQARRDLVDGQLRSWAVRQDLQRAGIEVPRTLRRFTDEELMTVGSRMLDAIDEGRLKAEDYPYLFEDGALERALLNVYEHTNDLPLGSITRQLTDEGTYSILAPGARAFASAMAERNPEALGRLAADHRAHAGLLEPVPPAALIENLPPEIRRVADRARNQWRAKVAEMEVGKAARDQIPLEGTRTARDAEGRLRPLAPEEIAPIGRATLSARQSRSFRNARRKVEKVGDRIVALRERIDAADAWDAPYAIEELRAVGKDLANDMQALERQQADLRAWEQENARRVEEGLDPLDAPEGFIEPQFVDALLEDVRDLYRLAGLNEPTLLREGSRVDTASSGTLYDAPGPKVASAAARLERAQGILDTQAGRLQRRIDLPDTVAKLTSRLDAEIGRARSLRRNPSEYDASGLADVMRDFGRAYDEAGVARPAWLRPDHTLQQRLRLVAHGAEDAQFLRDLRSARRADGLRLGTTSARATQRLEKLHQDRRTAADQLEGARREQAQAPAADVRKALDADRERLASRRTATASALRTYERLAERHQAMQTRLDEMWNEAMNTVEAAPATARPFLDAARTIAPQMDKLLRENGMTDLADTLDLNGLPATLDAMQLADIELTYSPRVMLDEAAVGEGYRSAQERVLQTPRPAFMRRRTIGDVATQTSFDSLNMQAQIQHAADVLKRETAEHVVKRHGRSLTQVLEENSSRLHTLRELDFLTEAMSRGRGGARSPILDHHAIEGLTKPQKERLAAQLGYVHYEPESIFSMRIRRTSNTDAWIPRTMADGLKVYRQAGWFESFVTDFIQPVTTKWKLAILAFRPGWHVYNAVGNVAMALASGAIDLGAYTRHYMSGEASQVVRDYFAGRDLSPHGLTQELGDRMFGGPNPLVSHSPLMDVGATPRTAEAGAINNEAIRSRTTRALSREQWITGRSRADRVASRQAQEAAAEGQQLIGALERARENLRQPGGRSLRDRAQGAASALNRAGNASYRANNYVDALLRTTIYLHQTQTLGKSPDAAMRVAMDTLGDYTKMTHVERLYIRTAMPFYAWLRHITKLMARMHGPDHITRTLLLEHLTNIAADPREQFEGAPEWAEGDIPLPGGMSLATRGFNPFGDVLDPITSAGRLNPIKGPLSQANPLIQLIAEQGTGIDLQTGRPFSRPVPVLNRDGQEVPTAPSVGSHLVDRLLPPQLPAARNLGVDAGRWLLGMDPEMRLPTYGSGDPVAIEGLSGRSSVQQLGSLFGFNVRQVDAEAMAERRSNAVDRAIRQRERYAAELEARRAEHEATHQGRSGLPGLILGR